MRVCIVGCGALGGLLAAHLCTTTAAITVVERGDRYRALCDHGLQLQRAGHDTARFRNFAVVDSLPGCDRFDVIFLAVKAQDVAPLAADLHRLVDDHTAIVTLQNGIPWWYFQRHGGPYDGRIIRCLDPQGTLTGQIASHHIVGCVAYPAAEVVMPGVIRHVEGVRFPVGELDGTVTPRVLQIAELLASAGLKSPVLADIRGEIWLKAWGNLAFNPISVLTHGTMAEIARFGPTRDFVVQSMSEAGEVAARLGVAFRVPLERRLQGAEMVGGHRTSMLQDLISRRPLELEAVLGAVIEIAELVNVSVPTLKGLNALCSLRNAINLGDATAGD